MKKKVLLSTLAMAAFMSAMPSVNAVAADDTTSNAVYDFSGFNDVNLINLFYQVYQDGRKYPTAAEFAAAGIQQSDIAFIRSHVRTFATRASLTAQVVLSRTPTRSATFG